MDDCLQIYLPQVKHFIIIEKVETAILMTRSRTGITEGTKTDMIVIMSITTITVISAIIIAIVIIFPGFLISLVELSKN